MRDIITDHRGSPEFDAGDAGSRGFLEADEKVGTKVGKNTENDQSAFDLLTNREGTFSSKWMKYQDRDVIPLWVADMDFRSPQPVLDALHKRVEHGVFGYTKPSTELINVILERLYDQYSWKIGAEDIVFLPGVVTGLNLACRSFCAENQAIVTFVPVYPPFMSAPVYSGRKLNCCEAEFRDDRWHFPMEKFAEMVSKEDTGLMLLCSPHNPLGRVLTREELQQIASICCDNQVVICSDEIHCDLVFDGKKHIPTATLGQEFAENTVTLLAPSKTYNIAGLGGSFAVIQNKSLRQKFENQIRGIVPNVNLLAYESMLAAYRDSEDWYQELMGYLQANRDLLFAEISNMPGIEMNQVEATYLAWLDIRQLRLESPMTFFEKAGLGLSDGRDFGGPGYMRLNFGCSRSLLLKAIERLDKAVRQR